MTATWVREPNVGIEFDRPVDVVELLSQAMTGPRPRMPRIATDCAASLRHGANVRRVRVVDVSQGGVKLLCGDGLTESEAVVVTLPGLAPVAGVLRWSDSGHVGVTFNHLIPLQSLVKWLRDRRDGLRATA